MSEFDLPGFLKDLPFMSHELNGELQDAMYRRQFRELNGLGYSPDEADYFARQSVMKALGENVFDVESKQQEYDRLRGIYAGRLPDTSLKIVEN
jgi:hypothetical protein